MSYLEGQILGHTYKLTRFLGECGMGAIYEAYQLSDQRKVAVKVMHTEMSCVPDAVSRFFRESKTVGQIGHPNLVQVYNVGKEEDDTIFQAMELLEGETLRERLAKEGRLSLNQTVAIALQILDGLCATHREGVVHRDLKSENVLLTTDAATGQEIVKLSDFGVAKIQDGSEAFDGASTQPSLIIEPPSYLSPEQARGLQDIDERVDVWAVGVMMYEALSGQLPFKGDSYNEVLGKILLEQPEPLGQLNPDLPAELQQIVGAAIHKDREQRVTSAKEFRDRLGRLDLPAPPPDPVQALEDAAAVGSAPLPLLSHPVRMDKLARFRALLSNRLLVYGTGGGVAVILLLVLGLVWFSPSGDTDAPEPHPRDPGIAAQVDADGPQPPPVAEPATAPEPPTPPPPTDTPKVTVEVYGLIPEAEVMLGDRRVEPPLIIEKSDRKVVLKAVAEGYQPYETTFSPNRDRKIKVSLIATGSKSKKRKKRSRKKSQDDTLRQTETGSTKTKVWAANPFEE